MLTVKLKHSPSAALEDHVRKGSSGLRLGFNIRLGKRVCSRVSHAFSRDHVCQHSLHRVK